MNKSSIFFIDKKRNSYSFNQFPEALYVDTCFWLELMDKGNSGYGRYCRQFFTDCLNNETIIVSSNAILEELDHVLKNSFLKYQIKCPENKNKIIKFNNGKINSKRTYENIVLSNNCLIEQLKYEISTSREFVTNNSLKVDYTSDEKFRDKIESIIENSKYMLTGKDSEHIAIAHNNGINSIATIDGDFWNTENLNIFTIPKDEYKMYSLDRANVFLNYDENKF